MVGFISNHFLLNIKNMATFLLKSQITVFQLIFLFRFKNIINVLKYIKKEKYYDVY